MDARHPEDQYLDLLRQTLTGEEQVDKGTGVKTYSCFGAQIRFDISEGFPLLTTKKVYWNGVVHELYWFLSGQSNIKYLVDNNVHIWDDYPYKDYAKLAEAGKAPELSKEAFIERIAADAAQEKRDERQMVLFGQIFVHRLEGPDVLRPIIRREGHAREHDLCARLL